MSTRTDEAREPATHALVMRLAENDFQHEVIQKLASLEVKMDMLVGSGQPGRISLIEDRVMALERNDVRRSVYDRLINAALATAVSVLIALHDRWWR